jgi:hypothetical protein
VCITIRGIGSLGGLVQLLVEPEVFRVGRDLPGVNHLHLLDDLNDDHHQMFKRRSKRRASLSPSLLSWRSNLLLNLPPPPSSSALQ